MKYLTLMYIKSIFVWFVLLFSAGAAYGQKAQNRTAERSHEVRSGIVKNGRIDLDTGVIRSVYRQNERAVYRSPTQYLSAEKARLGLTEPGDDLALVSDRHLSASRHVTYQQTHDGLPVFDHQMKVNLDRQGRVSLVISGFDPVRLENRGFDTQAVISESDASTRSISLVADGRGRSSKPELGIIRPKNPVLVWKVIVWPQDEPAEYRVYIDAKTGALVEAFNQAVSLRGDKHRSILRSDGVGFVYDPSPLYTAGASYGAPFVDANNATNASLDATRKSIVLRDLSRNSSGKWVLEGPYVSITGLNRGGTANYTPPAENTLDGFQYDRSQSGFEAVNAYYHLDKSQRYVQEIGILGRLSAPLKVNPQGLTSDDSFFYPDSNSILFGTGGVDDAEDPTVLWHEYAHALLEAGAPGLLNSQEGHAFHEGWADYWAASYLRSQVESGESVRTDWRKLFAWDSGDGSIWGGRTLNHTGKYPQDVCVTSSSSCNVHNDGRLWATTMMEVYDELGRELTDRLSLLSHPYLSFPVTFTDAAEAVIQADLDYYAGIHVSLLVDVFSSRGLVNAGNYGPIIQHEELPDTDRFGGSVQVNVTAIGVSSDITSVVLYTQFDSENVVIRPMSHIIDNTYEVSVNLPSVKSIVTYYFRVQDQGGRVSFLPEGAPSNRFSFVTGKDSLPPVIVHEPITEGGLANWPLDVVATVTDNLGVQMVTVDYELENSDGSIALTDSQIMSQFYSTYSGLLELPFTLLKNGMKLRYAIHAVDRSVDHNESRFPETGWISLDVTADGDLRLSGYEAAEFDLWNATGQWERGTPMYGKTAALSGSGVIGTNLDGAYANETGVSILTYAPLNLKDVSPAYLSFWHYYDTEHDGTVTPTSVGGSIWDGGFVQYKSVDTPAWTTLIPEGGYPGVIQADATNSWSGQPAYGGFSYGWQKADFDLPAEDGLEIRLLFATNATNSQFATAYAGWIVDQFKISTVRDTDTEAPVVLSPPASSMVASVNDPLPFVQVVVSDNTGVNKVSMHWSLSTNNGEESGQSWFTQDSETPNLFSIQTDMAFGARAGDRLTYYVEVEDVGGNVKRSPVGNEQNSILFRIQNQVNPIASVWASGSWMDLTNGRWEVTGETMDRLSTLNTNPVQIPLNAVDARLVLVHSYQFGADMASQVEISDNKGNTWVLLEPEGGYPGTAFSRTFSSMIGESAFTSNSNGEVSSYFDLSAWSGQQILLRFAAGAGSSSTINHKWNIEEVQLNVESDDDSFSTVRSFEVFPVYPNPFSSTANFTFELPEFSDVDIRVFDVLGREKQQVFKGVLSEGSHRFTLEGSSLVSGVYLVRIVANGRLRVAKVAVSHE